MSIRDDMVQKVLGNPGKYSIQQLQMAMKSGSLPAYVVVPIIQDKVQQQKQMQVAMQQQQPPQSTIAEQVMQEADQMGGGVAQLPSNLPQEYAEGGIVAFGDGGEVERYQGGGELDMAGELFAAPESIYTPAGPPPLTREEAEALIANLRAKKGSVGYGEVLEIMKRVPGATPQSTGGASGSWGTPAPAGKPPAAGPGAVGPGAAGPGAGGAGGIANIMEQLRKAQQSVYPEQRSIREELEPLLKGFTESADAREKARKEEAAQLRGQVTGKAYEGLEADLRKEAEQMGADKEQAKAMAIFKAGLAMMGGASRNALQNIGAGAMVGAEDYQKAAADIKKAQKENQRMLGHIEQARRAELRGDIEKRVEELGKASDREEKRDEFFVTSLGNAGIRDREQQRAMLQNLTTVAGSIHGQQLVAAASRARTEGRGELTPYQAQQLIMQARKDVQLADIRSELAKSKKMDKTPPAGVNATFDAEALRLYKQRLYEYAGVPLPEGSTTGQPVSLKDQGYNVLGPSR